MTAFRQGKLSVFAGPLKDRDGKLKVPAGKTLDLKALQEMDWLVSGVAASLPKK